MTVREMLPSEIALSAKLQHYFGSSDADPRLRTAAAYTAKLIREFAGGPNVRGDVLPWAKTHLNIRLRSGEVSLWPGINGHGKSLLTSQVAVDLVDQGKRVCIASLEMWPVKTLKRMARQAIGTSDPTDRVIAEFVDWLATRLWLYDEHGRADPRRIFAVMRYAALELKVEHFFMDSLMMVVKGEEDYDGQKDFVTEACAVAKDTGCHIHLIHHTKKLSSEYEVPGKFDAKGSGSITDQVDNVFTVWRNKKKEQERQNGTVDEGKPDGLLVCDKQRNGEWEGRVALWFDPASQTFRGEHALSMRKRYDLSPHQEEPGANG